MRAGSVVNIRVNPRDSMSVVDLVKQSGLAMEGMSFAQMVSLALSGCLEELRKRGVVPERSGFEYSEICRPYLQQRSGRKLAITEQIQSIGSEFKVELKLPTPEPKPTSEEEDAMWARAGYLQSREFLSAEEQLELNELIRKL